MPPIGNHGRSVAQGQLVGARSVIFVHAGVSDERVAAIARFAEMVRIDGTYDENRRRGGADCRAGRLVDRFGHLYGRAMSVFRAWSWCGLYGHSARGLEPQFDRPPTHVFVQAGVGGIAAALAGHFAETLEGSPGLRGGRGPPALPGCAGDGAETVA